MRFRGRIRPTGELTLGKVRPLQVHMSLPNGVAGDFELLPGDSITLTNPGEDRPLGILERDGVDHLILALWSDEERNE